MMIKINRVPFTALTTDGLPEINMPKTVLWLIIIFTAFFVIGVNTGEFSYLMNLGNTI
jgi:hypothetical protein